MPCLSLEPEFEPEPESVSATAPDEPGPVAGRVLSLMISDFLMGRGLEAG